MTHAFEPVAGVRRVASMPRRFGWHDAGLVGAVVADAFAAIALWGYFSADSEPRPVVALVVAAGAGAAAVYFGAMWLQDSGSLGFLYARVVRGELRVGRLFPLALFGRGVALTDALLAIDCTGVEAGGIAQPRVYTWTVASPRCAIRFWSVRPLEREFGESLVAWLHERGIAATVAGDVA